MKFKTGVPLRQLIRSSTSRLRKLRTLVLAALALGLVAPGAPGPGGLIGALLAADPGYQIVEPGEDYAVYQRVSAVADGASGVTAKTNQFTLLENCLNYFENGQWKESEDLIEPLPDGAVARRGPHKASFSSDLNAAAAFDILTSDGKRLRGGVRAIQLTDLASGKSVTLAKLKASAPGELLPPNQILYGRRL